MSLPRRQPKPHASASPDLALPKGPTRAEQRAARPSPSLGRRRPRAGLQKPERGTLQAERTASKRKRDALILLKKTEAKVRDFMRCRFPGCTVTGRELVEAAHLVDSGMGGRLSVSSHRSDYVTLCNHLAPGGGHHRGRRSVHSTHVEMRPLSDAGGDGRIGFWTRRTLDDPFTFAGETRPPVGRS